MPPFKIKNPPRTGTNLIAVPPWLTKLAPSGA